MHPFIWNDNDTAKLIELYKCYELLWNKKLPLYKDMYARQQAYLEIIKKLDMPIKETDLKKKIKNLRSTYYELQRKNQNTVITSRRPWIEALFSLMEQVAQTATKESDIAESSDDDIEPDEQDECMVSEVEEEPDTYVVSIKDEFFDDMHAQDTSTVADYLEPVVKKTKLASDDVDSQIIIKESPPSSPAPAPSPSGKKVARPIKLDEFQLFANSLAAQLRSLPLDRALSLEVDIQTLIVQERIKVYEESKK